MSSAHYHILRGCSFTSRSAWLRPVSETTSLGDSDGCQGWAHFTPLFAFVFFFLKDLRRITRQSRTELSFERGLCWDAQCSKVDGKIYWVKISIFDEFLMATFAVAQLYWEVGISYLQVINLNRNASQLSIPYQKVEEFRIQVSSKSPQRNREYNSF